MEPERDDLIYTEPEQFTTSTIYSEVRVGDNLCDKLKPSVWDSTKPSGRAKEVRPFDRHAGPRGYKGVRDVGKYKVDECRFSKL